MTVCADSGRIWKEPIVAYLKLILGTVRFGAKYENRRTNSNGANITGHFGCQYGDWPPFKSRESESLNEEYISHPALKRR